MALTINRIVRVNTQEVHMGGGQTVSRSPHPRLINSRMPTRSSDPLAASRCGGLGPGKGGSAEGQTQLHPKAGVLFVCLFILAVPPGSLAALGIEVGRKNPRTQLPCFPPPLPSANRAEGSAQL